MFVKTPEQQGLKRQAICKQSRRVRRILLIGEDNIYRAGVEAVLAKADFACEVFTDHEKANELLEEHHHADWLIVFVNPTDNIPALIGMCNLQSRAVRSPAIAFFNNSSPVDREIFEKIGLVVVADGQDADRQLLKIVRESFKAARPTGNGLNNVEQGCSFKQECGSSE